MMKPPSTAALAEQLAYLKLAFMLEQHGALAGEAARAQWDRVAYPILPPQIVPIFAARPRGR